jgi:hypothetical protein
LSRHVHLSWVVDYLARKRQMKDSSIFAFLARPRPPGMVAVA